MKIKKKFFPFTTMVILAVSVLTGCSENTSSNMTNNNAIEFNNTTLTGTVLAVDDNKISLSLAGDGMMNGNKSDKNPSERSSDDTGHKDEGRQNAKKINGNATTFTLTITDESVLQDISLSDIAKGAFLTITFTDNSTISSVTITDIPNMMQSTESNDVIGL